MRINEFIKAHGPLFTADGKVVRGWVPPVNGSDDSRGILVVGEARDGEK